MQSLPDELAPRDTVPDTVVDVPPDTRADIELDTPADIEPDTRAERCGERRCGPGLEGGSCGTCPAGYECTAAGQCVTVPYCESRECGNNGRGKSCGDCGPDGVCGPFNLCLPCTPDCAGRECGTDGCGGTCGECTTWGRYCTDGECLRCTGHCSNYNPCGSNGCGGYCGWCAEGTYCASDSWCAWCPSLEDIPCDCSGLECGAGRTDKPVVCCGTCPPDALCGAAGRCVELERGETMDELARLLYNVGECSLILDNISEYEYYYGHGSNEYAPCIAASMRSAYAHEEFPERLDAVQACLAERCHDCADDMATAFPCLRACLLTRCAEVVLARMGPSGPLTCRDAIACQETCGGENTTGVFKCLDATRESDRAAFLAWLACYYDACPTEPSDPGYCLREISCLRAARAENGACRGAFEACVGTPAYLWPWEASPSR